ncbi:MAG: hypothetical protein ACQET7_02410 [Thermodesulfobacteriota bacterium]
MVFFANLGVNLRGCLCGVLQYASAQPLDLLDIDKKSSFLNWKLPSAQKAFLDGHELVKSLTTGHESHNINIDGPASLCNRPGRPRIGMQYGPLPRSESPRRSAS